VSPAPRRRTAADLQRLWPKLGHDLGLTFAGPAGGFDGGDLRRTTRPGPGLPVIDVAVTGEGELAALGHPEYGSRHHELIGEPNTERTRNLVKLYVLAALRREARVQDVLQCTVSSADHQRDVVRIVLTVRLVDDDRPLDVVLPFDLAGGPA